MYILTYKEYMDNNLWEYVREDFDSYHEAYKRRVHISNSKKVTNLKITYKY